MGRSEGWRSSQLRFFPEHEEVTTGKHDATASAQTSELENDGRRERLEVGGYAYTGNLTYTHASNHLAYSCQHTNYCGTLFA
jgi:hypothetical protein